jgi:hypothetical protein
VSGQADSRSKSVEELHSDALGGPADEAIVEGFAGVIGVWRIYPTPTRLQHVPDAADHPAIINPALLRVPAGRCGAILANCASVSHKQSRSMCGLLRDPESRKPFHLRLICGFEPLERNQALPVLLRLDHSVEAAGVGALGHQAE